MDPHPTTDAHRSDQSASGADHEAASVGAHGQPHDDGPALGPIDVQAWAAGVAGVLLGLVVVLGFVLATSAVSG